MQFNNHMYFEAYFNTSYHVTFIAKIPEFLMRHRTNFKMRL